MLPAGPSWPVRRHLHGEAGAVQLDGRAADGLHQRAHRAEAAERHPESYRQRDPEVWLLPFDHRQQAADTERGAAQAGQAPA